MKKPQCKYTVATSICQVFYRQYMLSRQGIVAKNCFRTQNYIHYNQNLLKLTVFFPLFIEKDALSVTYIRLHLLAGKHLSSVEPARFLFRIILYA
jgi:hypothetical protein